MKIKDDLLESFLKEMRSINIFLIGVLFGIVFSLIFFLSIFEKSCI